MRSNKLTILDRNNSGFRKKLRIVKLIGIHLLCGFLQVQGTSLAQTININRKNTSLEYVLKEIKRQSNYYIICNAQILNQFNKIQVQVQNASLKQALNKILIDNGLEYTVDNNTIVITGPKEAVIANVPTVNSIEAGIQKNRSITGRVTDASTGHGIAGVTLSFSSGKNSVAVQTDNQGYYIASLAEGNYTISISSVGYESQRKSLQVKADVKGFDFSLKENLGVLDQVVVTAYGTSKVKDITGSISSLGVKDMENAPMGATIQSLLQGKASGVNVAIQSASPTSPISVIIRGASSLSGSNQPLWVIDGVPDYSTSTSGNIANSLYNLNINDVVSIDILKDASATALYGSRAANGVVIVTTKRGVAGMKPTIELSSRIGYQTQNFNGYKYMDAPQYIDFADKAAREEVFARGSFDYFTRLYLDEQAFFNLRTSEFDRSDLKVLPGTYYEGNTNWMNEMTQNPIVQQYDLSLRGGTDNVSYYVSLYGNLQEGIVKTGNSDLFGGRLNMETRIREGLKFGLNLSGSSRKTDIKDYMLDVLKKIRPDIPPYNPDGSLFTRDAYTENPYTTLRNTENGNGQTFNGTGFLEYQIIKGLLLKSAYTVNYSNGQNLKYKWRGSTFNYDGAREWTNPKNQTSVWENTLTYANTFGKHDILGLAGYSMEKNQALLYGMAASNFPDDEILNNFNAGASRGALREEYNANTLVSQFARVHYKYNDRYIISGTVRRDGSSRFGPDRRWGVFPSVAGAWLITEENFMKNDAIQKYVSYLKLRASTGRAGSQNLGNYDWISRIGSSRYNENPAMAPSSMGNYTLQWEETQMTDLGLDFGFWNERVRGTVGYYRKDTDKLIYGKPLPPSTAYTSINSNVASVQNKGIEFDVAVDVFKKSEWLLTLDVNASKNTNYVTKINGIAKELFFPNSTTYYMKVEEGGRTGEWFGYKTANRLFTNQEEIIALQKQSGTGAKQYFRNSLENPGDLYYMDQNGDGLITADDRVYLGSSDPKLYGGFGASLFYKNFMINTTFVYAFGHTRLWKMAMDDAGYVGNYNHSNLIAGQSATLLDPSVATMPRMTHYGDGGNGTFSDFWLYDASYLRLNALNMSYKMPSSFFQNKLLAGVEFTFQASNLFTITRYPGFDPQGNWSSSSIGTGMGVDNSYYPSAKNYNFGLKLTLK